MARKASRTAASVTAKALAESLQKQPPSAAVYALVGEEPYLRYHSWKAIARAMEDPAILRLPGDETEAEKLVPQCHARTLSGQVQLVILDNTDRRRSWTEQAKKRDVLTGYCKKPAPETRLVFLSEKIPGNLKLARAIKEHGVWVDCSPLDASALQAWVVRQARKRNIVLSSQRARQIIDIVGPDMQMLQSELGKLDTYLGDDGAVEPELLREILSYNGKSAGFDLIGAIGRGDMPGAMKCVRDLIRSNESPYGLIGLINWRLRQHWKVAGAISSGTRLPAAVRAARLPRFAEQAFAVTQRKLDLDRCRKVHDLLIEADTKASPLGGETELQLFIIRACRISADKNPG